jgi:hypothetical protein
MVIETALPINNTQNKAMGYKNHAALAALEISSRV